MPFLHTVVAEIGSEYRAIVSHGHGDGVLKLPVAAPFGAETAQKYAIGREFLNPVIIEVSSEYIPVLVNGNAGHRGKPAVEWPEDVHGERAAPFAQECPIGAEGLNAVVVAVGYIKCSIQADRHIRWVIEFTCPDADLAG